LKFIDERPSEGFISESMNMKLRSSAYLMPCFSARKNTAKQVVL